MQDPSIIRARDITQIVQVLQETTVLLRPKLSFDELTEHRRLLRREHPDAPSRLVMPPAALQESEPGQPVGEDELGKAALDECVSVLIEPVPPLTLPLAVASVAHLLSP